METAMCFRDAFSATRSHAGGNVQARTESERRTIEEGRGMAAAVRQAIVGMLVAFACAAWWRGFLRERCRSLLPDDLMDTLTNAELATRDLDGSLLIPFALGCYIWRKQLKFLMKLARALSVFAVMALVIYLTYQVLRLCNQRRLPIEWDPGGVCRTYVKQQCEPAASFHKGLVHELFSDVSDVGGAHVTDDGRYVFAMRNGVKSAINQLDMRSAIQYLFHGSGWSDHAVHFLLLNTHTHLLPFPP